MGDIIHKIIAPTEGPSLVQQLKDIQERGSTREGFHCEHPRCANRPDYITYNPWLEEMMMKCNLHRHMTDIIIRWFNSVHRVWEMP